MAFDPAVHVIGNNRIYIKTEKAGTFLNLKLYNQLSRIIAFLQAYPLPPMSNQDFNQHLKIVAALASITHLKLSGCWHIRTSGVRGCIIM